AENIRARTSTSRSRPRSGPETSSSTWPAPSLRPASSSTTAFPRKKRPNFEKPSSRTGVPNEERRRSSLRKSESHRRTHRLQRRLGASHGDSPVHGGEPHRDG